MEPAITGKSLANVVYEKVQGDIQVVTKGNGKEGAISIGDINKVVLAVKGVKGCEALEGTAAIGKLAESLIAEGKKSEKQENLGKLAIGISDMALSKALPFTIRADLKIAGKALSEGKEISLRSKLNIYVSEAVTSILRFVWGKSVSEETLWKVALEIANASTDTKRTEALKNLKDDYEDKNLSNKLLAYLDTLISAKTLAAVAKAVDAAEEKPVAAKPVPEQPKAATPPAAEEVAKPEPKVEEKSASVVEQKLVPQQPPVVVPKEKSKEKEPVVAEQQEAEATFDETALEKFKNEAIGFSGVLKGKPGELSQQLLDELDALTDNKQKVALLLAILKKLDKLEIRNPSEQVPTTNLLAKKIAEYSEGLATLERTEISDILRDYNDKKWPGILEGTVFNM